MWYNLGFLFVYLFLFLYRLLKEVLSFLGTPVPTMPAAGVDFIDWNAMVNARREGFFEAIRLLGALTEEPAPAEELPQPWEKSTNQLNETEGTQI